MDCGCLEYKQKIHDKCPKHHHNELSHFCASHSCLELLCPQCLKEHKQLHNIKRIPEADICQLIQIEQFYDVLIKKELKYQEEIKPKQGEVKLTCDPCAIMCQYVDEYFNGSGSNKKENLQREAQVMEHPNSKSFIDIIESSGQYRLSTDFKADYFEFLDFLLNKVEEAEKGKPTETP